MKAKLIRETVTVDPAYSLALMSGKGAEYEGPKQHTRPVGAVIELADAWRLCVPYNGAEPCAEPADAECEAKVRASMKKLPQALQNFKTLLQNPDPNWSADQIAHYIKSAKGWGIYEGELDGLAAAANVEVVVE